MLTTTHQPTTCRAAGCSARAHARSACHRQAFHIRNKALPQTSNTRTTDGSSSSSTASSSSSTTGVTSALLQANRQWLQHALDNKLVDAETGCTVVLVGACFFAPLQEQLVQAALQHVQPDYIAIEQPADATSAAGQPGVLLPHPMWIQTLLDNEDALQPALRRGLAAAGSTLQQQPPLTLELQQLEQQLLDIGHPAAKVGRDIMDPWETFGFYGALDLARAPAVLVPVLQRCGFLPGLELLAAATYALEQGVCCAAVVVLVRGIGLVSWVQGLLHTCGSRWPDSKLCAGCGDCHAERDAAGCSLLCCVSVVAQLLQFYCLCCTLCALWPVFMNVCPCARAAGAALSCVDASLKLQEAWVKTLLDNFTMDEQHVKAYQPAKDLAANEQLLPPAAQAWDRQMAAAAQQLQAAVQAGAADASQASAEQQSLLLFKVSRATAAAMLSPGAAQEAMQRLQRLQPLKWAHFALRQRYMARQVKELCAAAAKAAGLQPSVAVRQQQQVEQSSSSSAAGSQGREPAAAAATGKVPTVLVVVGRQHVHGLQAMWQDAASPLWRDRMPRSFAESVVERGGADDSTADTAGSTQQAGSAAASQQEQASAG